MGERWGVTFVRPSKHLIEKRELHELESVDSIVEKLSKGGIKAIIVFVVLRAYKIKVPSEKPRARHKWRKLR